MTTHRQLIPKTIRPAIRFCYASARKALLSALHSKMLLDNETARRAIFNFSSPDSLLVSDGSEIFIVAASDRVIGRLVYIRKKPFDFRKLETVVDLLGPERKKRLLIDIGANIGTICIPAVKRGLFQKAIAIEPEPRNYSLLMANIFLNQVSDRIAAHNVALGQKDNDSLIFELCDYNHGDHRVRANNNAALQNEDARNTIKVKAETFNKIISEDEARNALIAIDTQGWEGFVFSGASHALKNKTPICLEFWPYGMARSGGYPLLKENLMNNGYTSFYNLDEPPYRSVPLSVKALDELYDRLGEKEVTFSADLLVI